MSVPGRRAVGSWLMCRHEAKAQNTLDTLNRNMVAGYSQKSCIAENRHLSWVFCHIILTLQIHCLLVVVSLLMTAKIALSMTVGHTVTLTPLLKIRGRKQSSHLGIANYISENIKKI